LENPNVPIPFTCPHCGVTTDVANQYAGHGSPCARCGKRPTSELEAPASHSVAPRERLSRQIAKALWDAAIWFIMLPIRFVREASVAARILLAIILMDTFGMFLAQLLPAVQSARESGRRATCVHNLERIGLAMHSYHEKYGGFPPAYIPDENGKPMHSWRVLILPFMDQQTLYAKYRFDEPWNGEHNMELAAKMPREYRCPSDPTPGKPETTNYAMLVGPHAISDGPHGRRLDDITDSPSKTIMVAEAIEAGINWLKPRDLDAEKMTFRIKRPNNVPQSSILDISSRHPGGAEVLFCDGSVMFISDDVAPKVIEALTTIDGGETVDLNELSH
jgi:prepilin-type processing-associated H-X9-DG protein